MFAFVTQKDKINIFEGRKNSSLHLSSIENKMLLLAFITVTFHKIALFQGILEHNAYQCGLKHHKMEA